MAQKTVEQAEKLVETTTQLAKKIAPKIKVTPATRAIRQLQQTTQQVRSLLQFAKEGVQNRLDAYAGIKPLLNSKQLAALRSDLQTLAKSTKDPAILRRIKTVADELKKKTPDALLLRREYNIARALYMLKSQIGYAAQIPEAKETAKITRAAFSAVNQGDFRKADAILSCQELYLRSSKEKEQHRAFELAKDIYQAKTPKDYIQSQSEAIARNAARSEKGKGTYSRQSKKYFELSSQLYEKGMKLEGDLAVSIASTYKELGDLNRKQRKAVATSISFLEEKGKQLETSLSKSRTLAQISGLEKPEKIAGLWQKESTQLRSHIKAINFASFNTSLNSTGRQLRRRKKPAQDLIQSARDLYNEGLKGKIPQEAVLKLQAARGLLGALNAESILRKNGLPEAAKKYREAAKQYSKVKEGADKQTIFKEAERMMKDAAKTGRAAFVRKQFISTKRGLLRKLRKMESQIRSMDKEISTATDNQGRKIFTAKVWLNEISRQAKAIKAAKTMTQVAEVHIDLRDQVRNQYVQAKRVKYVERMMEDRSRMLDALRTNFKTVQSFKKSMTSLRDSTNIRLLSENMFGTAAHLQLLDLGTLLKKVKAGTATDAELTKFSHAFQSASKSFETRRKGWSYMLDAMQQSMIYSSHAGALKQSDRLTALNLEIASKSFDNAMAVANDVSIITAERGTILPKELIPKHVVRRRGMRVFDVNFGERGGQIFGKTYAIDARGKVLASFDYHMEGKNRIYHLSKKRRKGQSVESYINSYLDSSDIMQGNLWQVATEYMERGFASEIEKPVGNFERTLKTLGKERFRTWQELIRLKTSGKADAYQLRSKQNYMNSLEANFSLAVRVQGSTAYSDSQKKAFHLKNMRSFSSNILKPQAILRDQARLERLQQDVASLRTKLGNQTSLTIRYQTLSKNRRYSKGRRARYERLSSAAFKESGRITKQVTALESQISSLAKKHQGEIVPESGAPMRALANFNRAEEKRALRIEETEKALELGKGIAILGITVASGGAGMALWGADMGHRMAKTGQTDVGGLVMFGSAVATMGLGKIAQMGVKSLEAASMAGRGATRIQRLMAATQNAAKFTGVASGAYGLGYGVVMASEAVKALPANASVLDYAGTANAIFMGALPGIHAVKARIQMRKAVAEQYRALDVALKPELKPVEINAAETQARAAISKPAEARLEVALPKVEVWKDNVLVAVYNKLSPTQKKSYALNEFAFMRMAYEKNPRGMSFPEYLGFEAKKSAKTTRAEYKAFKNETGMDVSFDQYQKAKEFEALGFGKAKDLLRKEQRVIIVPEREITPIQKIELQEAKTRIADTLIVPAIQAEPKVTAVERRGVRRAKVKPAKVISIEEAKKIRQQRQVRAQEVMMEVMTAQVQKLAVVGGGGAPVISKSTAVIRGKPGKARKPIVKLKKEAEVDPKTEYETSSVRISQEIELLKGIDSGYQTLYERGGRQAVEKRFKFDPESVTGKKVIEILRKKGDFKSLNVINEEFLSGARRAVNKELLIRPEEFVISRDVYEVIINGRLRSNIEAIMGESIKGNIIIRKEAGISGSAHVLKFETASGKKMTLFMKPLSGDIEVVMVKIFREGGKKVTDYHALKFDNSRGRPREYVTSLDVRHMKNVDNRVSLRALERPEFKRIFEELSKDLSSESSQVATSLGYQSHLSLVVGLQDLNPRNIFILQTRQKGKTVLTTTRIDFDMGFCYPTGEGISQQVYSSYLRDFLKHLNTASIAHTGKPLTTTQVNTFFTGFLSGVKDAAQKVSEPKFKTNTMRRISEFDGKPIGIGGELRRNETGSIITTTQNEVNRGPVKQPLILDDRNNMGRIRMDARVVRDIFDDMASLGETRAVDMWLDIINNMPHTRPYSFSAF
jgi:hypothetical protein